MAVTLEVADGDIVKDSLNQLAEKIERPLVAQHIFEELMNSVSGFSDAIDLRNEFLSFVQGILGLRIQYSLDRLKDLLGDVKIVRTSQEKISRIESIRIVTDFGDKRNIKFWVRAITEAGDTVSVEGVV